MINITIPAIVAKMKMVNGMFILCIIFELIVC